MGIDALCGALEGLRVIELGQYLEERMPVHPSHSRFYKTVWHSFGCGDACNDNQLILNEHNGTHVDSFGHYIDRPGFEMIDEIPPRCFCGPCRVVDATHLGENRTLERQDLLMWEDTNGLIREGEVLLFDYGWMKLWDLRPNDKAFTAGYPGLGRSAAELLVERRVKLVGVDTLSVDRDGADGDPAHNLLLGNRIPVVENLRNLGLLIGKRAYFVMLPLLIREGSASPVRPIALVEE